MKNVVFLMLKGAQLLDFAGPHDVLMAANQVLRQMSRPANSSSNTHPDPLYMTLAKNSSTALSQSLSQSLYRITIVSEHETVTVGAEEQLQIAPATKLDHFRGSVDTLIVVGGQNLIATCSPRTASWVRRVSKRARRTVSICTGSFVLAAAGLLDGRLAATHWIYCDLLAKRYPKVEVDPSSIYVQDESIYTSAGVCSGIDLCLHLVEEDHGPKVALSVARGLVVHLRRPGGQQQFSQLLKEQYSGSSDFNELVPWIVDNLRRDLSVENMASKCSMSARNFARKFKENFSVTPARYVLNRRLDSAKLLLAESNLALNQIAKKCGFSDEAILRKAFMRIVKMNPSEYRRLWQT